MKKNADPNRPADGSSSVSGLSTGVHIYGASPQEDGKVLIVYLRRRAGGGGSSSDERDLRRGRWLEHAGLPFSFLSCSCCSRSRPTEAPDNSEQDEDEPPHLNLNGSVTSRVWPPPLDLRVDSKTFFICFLVLFICLVKLVLSVM